MIGWLACVDADTAGDVAWLHAASIGDPPVAAAVVPAELTGPTPFLPGDDPRVLAWTRAYLGPGREPLARALTRYDQLADALDAELDRAMLPRELGFVVVVESGGLADVTSLEGARGLWQLAPETAIARGLRVDAIVDERTDPTRSTAAAVAELGWLYERFDDPLVALTAYDAGAAIVSDAIVRAGSGRYDRVAAELGPEARNYVPKLSAVAAIARSRADGARGR